MANALIHESSPYLRQHADNPVDWLPWSQQALDLARDQDKPILLSIGYSACHWCHVMAHESFEDETTAALMNRHFINIKVDREERPDLDRIYQLAHQLMKGRGGGWPLTVFLAPTSQLPFFAGTYFPPTPANGLIAFTDLLQRLADIYQQEPQKIHQQADTVKQTLLEIEMRERQNQHAASLDALASFEQQFLQAFDAEHGGLGQAPKFPQAAILQQALARAFSDDSSAALRSAIDFTLQQIARGGIQDHVGGGFFRYSVDERWMIPHFEKMLSDNGQLLTLFGQAFRLTGNPLFRAAADGIAGWLEREMTNSSGAFYTALDADSEGVEGKFYLWTPEQAAAAIDARDYAPFANCFGLDGAPNFEQQWHLHRYQDEAPLCTGYDLEPRACRELLQRAAQRLLVQRNTRPRPGLDDKVLTSCNALAIRGLASAAGLLTNPAYYRLAEKCLAVIRSECWQGGRLLAQSQRSGKRMPAYLDDYAHLLQALLECLQYRWDSATLQFAIKLAEQLIEYFTDTAHGGFFFTASDHEKLIQRPKSWPDEAMPSGNASAALALHRLGLLTGSTVFTECAERALQSVADNVNQTPLHAASFVALLNNLQQPPLQIIVRGEPAHWQAWRDRLLARLKPAQSIFFIANDAADLPAALADKKAGADPCAWVCEGLSCREPLFDMEALLALIDE